MRHVNKRNVRTLTSNRILSHHYSQILRVRRYSERKLGRSVQLKGVELGHSRNRGLKLIELLCGSCVQVRSELN